MTAIAIAALSARALAECAAQEGVRCIALDLFGDLDTRRCATAWHAIGDRDRLEIDGDRLLAALARLARDGAAQGWVAGSGFEGRADLLQAGGQVLPLWGTAGADVRRLRDPRDFFGTLDAARVPHPPVRFDPVPAGVAGWLCKDGGGAGGWQVRRAVGEGEVRPGVYWQLERPQARPMSATFVADGATAVVLGLNRLHVQAWGDRPYVFRGAVGPVVAGDAVHAVVDHALAVLVPRYRLRGLGSLDFLLHDDGAAEVLEVNPRPPATLSLYPRIGRGGPWGAHLEACRARRLPPRPAPAGVRGVETVFAAAPCRWGDAAACLASGATHLHDLPAAGTVFAAGEPVCTLSAEGTAADAVQAALARRAADLLNLLEPLS